MDTSTAAYVHRVQATGLEFIEIDTSQQLQNTSGTAARYVLVRPWHSSLLDASGVASSCRILARPTDSSGVLQGEAMTLVIK